MDKTKYLEMLKTVDAKSKVDKQPEFLTENTYLDEVFIQQGEIENMKDGLSRDLAMLRLAIIAELDAVNLYIRFAELSTNPDIKKVMLDIANEEKVHAGEFQTLLQNLDSQVIKSNEEGQKEVEDLTGIKT